MSVLSQVFKQQKKKKLTFFKNLFLSQDFEIGLKTSKNFMISEPT